MTAKTNKINVSAPLPQAIEAQKQPAWWVLASVDPLGPPLFTRHKPVVPADWPQPVALYTDPSKLVDASRFQP